MKFSYLGRRSFFHLLSVYAIFLLLMLLLMIPILNRAGRTLEKSALASYTIEITRNTARFDEQIESFFSTLKKIVDDKDYSRALRSYEESNESLMMFKKIRERVAAASFAFLNVRDLNIISEHGVIITRERVYPLHNQMNSYFYGADFQIEGIGSMVDLLETIRKNKPFVARVSSEAYRSYDALIFSLPIYAYNTWLKIDVYFAVDLQSVMKETAPVIFSEQGSYTVLDSEGNTLYSSQAEGQGQDDVSIACDSQFGLRFVFSAPRSVVFSGVGQLIRAIYLTLFLMLGGGAVIAIFFAWRNHLPLVRLTNKARSLSGTQTEDSRNIYEYLALSMTSMKEKIQISEDQANQQRRYIQNNLLEKALLGHVATASAYRSFDRFLPDLPSEYHLVMVTLFGIQEENADNLLSRQVIIERMLSEVFREQKIYDLFFSASMFVMILPAPLDIEKAVHDFRDHYVKTFRLPVNIYISDLFQGVDSLQEAYSQVKRIQHMAISRGRKQGIYDAGSFETHEWNMRLDYTVFQQLYEALTVTEKDNAIACLRRLYLMMPDYKESPENIMASTFNRTLDFALSVMQRVKRENLEALKAVQLYTPDLNQPLKAYFAVLEEYAAQICDVLSQARKKPLRMEDEIIAYIDQNITDLDLCAKTITNRFDISENVLQSIMHEKRGASLADYVEDQRMNVARRLLINTGLTVQQVAEQSGFALYNTFYKAVRRRWNCSPSDFRAWAIAADREKHKQEESTD